MHPPPAHPADVARILASASAAARLGATLFGLDHLIAGLGHGSPLVVLGVAVLLGLRHATDPDHLVAVSTLVAFEPDRRGRRAAMLGLAWGAGHATTLLALGLTFVLAGAQAPPGARRGAEVAVGVLIAALALRGLRAWRRGRFHTHAHRHGPLVHRHLHPHAGEHHGHEHPVYGRLQAYVLGLVHGVGGSAAVTVLLLASIGDDVSAALALVLFTVATALSMAAASLALGLGLASERAARIRRLTPVLGSAALVFGVWYAVGALAGP